MKKEKTMHELSKEFPDKSYRELEIYREKDRQQEAGACIMGEMRKDREVEKEIDYHRYWKDMYEKEHKLRQEAEGETTIVKGIGMNSPEMKTAQAKLKELEEGLANALAINESHQKLNGKLQEGLTELEEENKKLHNTLNKKMDDVRKAGL